MARFRVEEHIGSSHLIIDRFAVLSDYRQKRVAYKLLHGIISQVVKCAISAIFLRVPENSWLEAKLMLFGLTRVECSVKEFWGVVPQVTLVLLVTEQTSSLSQIRAYLLGKASS